MRFRLLFALTVFAVASFTFADNLPPVPKNVPTDAPTVAPPQQISTATIKIAIQDDSKSPKACEAAQMLPPPPKACEEAQPTRDYYVPAQALPKTCEPAHALAKTCEPPQALPKTCEPAQAYCSMSPLPPAATDLKKLKKTPHVVGTSVKFVTNELVRKPVLEVEKALHEADHRRLDREEERLNNAAEDLAARSAGLSEKIKATDPTDLHQKLNLVIKERDFAKEANNLAVRRAALELKQSNLAEKCKKLSEKDDKLNRHAD